MTFGKGFIQVYTGPGKGKTTAAIGLAVRALGAGKRVLFLQFMKDQVYSEHKLLPRISPQITVKTLGKPFFVAREGELDATKTQLKDKVVVFPPGSPPAEYLELAREGMNLAQEAVTGGDYDLVIIDEINVALHYELVSTEALLALLEKKKEGVEVVLTGRNAPRQLLEKADLVTEMREIKHYYNQGVTARKGIEA